MKNENSNTKIQPITIEAFINAPIEKVWAMWNDPKDIVKWCQASDDWHAPFAEVDLKTGGTFKTTMAAKDGSFSFDFQGTYTNVKPMDTVEYDIPDGRHVATRFSQQQDGTNVVGTFDPESENPRDQQRDGWQAILDSFKKYVESNSPTS